VSGPFYDTKDSVMAITGGPGKWARAHGEMRLHARNAKGTAYNFTFSVRDLFDLGRARARPRSNNVRRRSSGN
ncbi:MAG: hypothetical protein QOH17_5022, partial [Pseudonocardiales bacterium]|nr:hypothetical protein [Pseudonocardiales bacterium]